MKQLPSNGNTPLSTLAAAAAFILALAVCPGTTGTHFLSEQSTPSVGSLIVLISNGQKETRVRVDRSFALILPSSSRLWMRMAWPSAIRPEQ